MNNIKESFPFFKKTSWNYLDSAATSQKPKVLLNALEEYYYKYNSNIGRSVYNLAYESEQVLMKSMQTINSFLGKDGWLSFSDGCTASLNEAVFYVENNIKKYKDKDTIVLSVFEHHANIMAWQRLAKKHELKIYWIESAKELEDFNNVPVQILQKTIVISVCHVNNVTGEINNLQTLNNIKEKFNILIVIDGAQSVTNIEFPLKDLNVDFYAFSAHKLYGPMGLGVLWINKNINISNPSKLGGGIIDDVTKSEYILSNENNLMAGTPNIANIYALAQVIDWIKNIEKPNYLDNITYLTKELKQIKNVHVLEISKNLFKTNIVSMFVDNTHAHDLGSYLGDKKIAVRAGRHCAHTFLEQMHVNSSIRVSLGIYNTKEDVDNFLLHFYNAINYFVR